MDALLRVAGESARSELIAMIKGAITSMARYVKVVPQVVVPLARSPARYVRSSVPASHFLSSWAWPCDSTRLVRGGGGLGRASWLGQSLPRGFASSSSKDGGDVSTPATASGTPAPSLPDGSVNQSSGAAAADTFTNVAESARNAVNTLVESSREAAAKVFPSVDNWMDPSGGGVTELLVPVTSSICFFLVAWLLLPTVLRKFHSYVESGEHRISHSLIYSFFSISRS